MRPSEVAHRFTTATGEFEEMARAALEFQIQTSPIYGRYAGGEEWTNWSDAPYLPVEAFKWSGIVPESAHPEIVFASSGTGGVRSRHPVLRSELYVRSVIEHFRLVLGDGPFHIVAHLPTYRSSVDASSLIYMVESLISGFGTVSSRFVDEPQTFVEAVSRVDAGARLIVFGTAFGLLDMIDDWGGRLVEGAIVIETGGMKTFRREVDREELHARLAAGFGLERDSIRSEYGMCELLSQCYTRGDEVFFPPPWMRFKVVDVDNPERLAERGYPGLLAVFDLANLYSVSAILTSDLAIDRSGGFELLGRADAAEIRGCNFLMQSDP